MAEKLPLNGKEKLDYDLRVWKVAIDTQMHFNDLLIKMRTTVTSIILAVFGAAAIILRDSSIRVKIFDGYHHISVIVLFVGFIFLLGQGVVDFFYYFRLLLGAVAFTKKIDEKYKENDLFGLTASISDKIPPCWAGALIIIYYLVPIILIWFAIVMVDSKIIAN